MLGMTNFEISEKNLLSRLHEARFGDIGDYQKNARFFNELKLYQKIAIRNEKEAISLPAISRWFRPPQKSPKRIEALRFLLGYLMWINSRDLNLTELQRGQVASLMEYLRQQVEHLIPPEKRRLDLSKVDTSRQQSVARDALERMQAIEGTYQIIRALSEDKEGYALEVMSIEIETERKAARLLMYSHNQAVDGFLYIGDIWPSSRYCFGVVSRSDEEEINQRAYRCMSLYVAHRKVSNGYTSRPCLSGIMMRGVKGAITKGEPSVAVPFIAIRAPHGTENIRAANFQSQKGSLCKLSAESSILIGIVESKHGIVYEFCSRLFSSIRPHLIRGLALQTVMPSMVESAILGDLSKSDDEYFGVWKTAVSSYVELG
jgi:hypothetical protein